MGNKLKPEDIQIVTNPNDVAALIDPTAGSFQQTLAEIEADKANKAKDAAKLAELTEKSKPKAQLIKLEYRFSGTCPDCIIPIKTLIADVKTPTGKQMVAFAFCDKCTTQFNTVEVEPIKQEISPILEPITPVEEVKTVPIAKSGIILPKKDKQGNY